MINRPIYVDNIMEYEETTAKVMYTELKSKLASSGKTYLLSDKF